MFAFYQFREKCFSLPNSTHHGLWNCLGCSQSNRKFHHGLSAPLSLLTARLDATRIHSLSRCTNNLCSPLSLIDSNRGSHVRANTPVSITSYYAPPPTKSFACSPKLEIHHPSLIAIDVFSEEKRDLELTKTLFYPLSHHAHLCSL
jgi:hypothetical protein